MACYACSKERISSAKPSPQPSPQTPPQTPAASWTCDFCRTVHEGPQLEYMACHNCDKPRQTAEQAKAFEDQRAADALQIASTAGVDGSRATRDSVQQFAVPNGHNASERLAVNGQMAFLALGQPDALAEYQTSGRFPERMTVVVTGDLKQIETEGVSRSSDRNVPVKGCGEFILNQDGNVKLPALFKLGATNRRQDPTLVTVRGDEFDRAFVYLWPLHIRLVNSPHSEFISELVPECLQPAQHEVFAFLWALGSVDPTKSNVVFIVRTCTMN